MTREEAINIITKERDEDIFGGWTPHRKRIHEAFTLAIEALEQERQRQEDIYECQYCFGEVHKNYTYCPFCGERTDGIMLSLAKKPSADRQKGEWEEVDSFESEKHSVTDMRCSLCGKYASMVLPHKTKCVYKFCPWCGEDMLSEYERAVEQMEHDTLYESTYNPEDGSM